MTKAEVIRIRTALKQDKNLPLMVFIDNAFEIIDENAVGKFTKWDDEHETLWYFTPTAETLSKPQQTISVFAVPYEHIQAMQATRVPAKEKYVKGAIDAIKAAGVTFSDEFKDLIVHTYKVLYDPNFINGSATAINNLVSSNRLQSDVPNAVDEHDTYKGESYLENPNFTKEIRKYNESIKDHVDKYHKDLKDSGKVLDLAEDKSVSTPKQ